MTRKEKAQVKAAAVAEGKKWLAERASAAELLKKKVLKGGK